MVTPLGKKPQVSRHYKCWRIALVDVTTASNIMTQKSFGGRDRSTMQNWV